MIRRFCLHVRANKLQHQKGIWLPILYHEMYKNDTVLVQGWVADHSEHASWHVWCESAAGEKLDPQIILLEMDELYYVLNYKTDKPENTSEDEEVVQQWELYEKNPKDFWKLQSPEVKSFRSKIFSLFAKGKF